MKKYHVIIPHGMQPLPESFELSAADILAGFSRADVTFLPVTSDKTPDIVVDGVRWEIKSPLGKGKRNLQHQIHRAMKQSKSIVFDARRSKIDIRKTRNYLKKYVKEDRRIKRLVLITKTEQVEVIK
jgi:hypothetical protein